MVTLIALFIPQSLLVPPAVYPVNGTSDFKMAAVLMTVICLIFGLSDRLLIDWYWAGKTKAWIIPGAEEMMPYIHQPVIRWHEMILICLVTNRFSLSIPDDMIEIQSGMITD